MDYGSRLLNSLNRVSGMADPENREILEMTADNHLLVTSNRKMAEKLQKARRLGRGGWWCQEECSTEELEALLSNAIADRDFVSAMNYSAMLHLRQEAGI